jgi:1-acyl-sn-glycerol-3-phosphate acyltransferase
MRLGSPFLGAARLAAYLAFTLALIPVQAVLVATGSRFRDRLPYRYHRICARLLGIALDVVGRPSADRPMLVVSNHSSYLDIVVLGGLVPGSFVAKTEVGAWPFFGLLAKLQRTVFVDRKVRNAAAHRDDMRARIEAGDVLILFPEGTSSDGNRTLPFKTALFSVAGTRAGDRPVTVQPVSVAATRLDGIPLGRGLRPLYAWYGDMDLVGHLWRMVGLGRLTVRVQFHDPVTVDDFPSRKALGEHCWQVIAGGVAAAVSGRPAPEPVPAAPAPAPQAAPPAAEARENGPVGAPGAVPG